MFGFEYVKDIVKKNYISLIGISIGIISIIASGVYVFYNQNDCELERISYCDEKDIKEEEPMKDEEKFIKVDVKGAVKKTGVYELKSGSNISDAIKLAGGITSKGSTKNINLSKKLTDEMVIYVFTKDELKKNESSNEVVCEIPKCECETIEIVECPSINKPSDNNSTDQISEKISINKGSLEELTKLDGIGESKAQAIIDYREKNGEFKKIEDLMNVSGIGEKALEKIKDKITL